MNTRKHVLFVVSMLLNVYMAGMTKADELWSADFEATEYTVNTYLTGQQGWWHPQGWSSGLVIASGGGQLAQLGSSQGWNMIALTPWINNELSQEKRFKIFMTITPGGGSLPMDIQLMDNNGNATVFVKFDSISGHILAKGTVLDSWSDSGVTYTAGNSYNVEIVKDDNTWTFHMKVNGSWVLRHIPCGSAVPGIGYLYFNGGGNGGTYIPNQYTYLDNICIESLSDVEQIWSADFESPSYITNTFLTGQQGWWHWHDADSGWVEAFSGGQRCRLGWYNGYKTLVISPWINEDTDMDKHFKISFSFCPGSGSDNDAIRVMNDNAEVSIIIEFDRSTGHILAKGTDAATWEDTGITYTPGTKYWLETYKNDNNHTFSLCVNGTMVLRNIVSNVAYSGLGYLWFYGGGNGGTPITNQYAYIDDVSIDFLPDVEMIWACDFQGAGYIANTYLTGQLGWWNQYGLNCGRVIDSSGRWGAYNGYNEAIRSPWVNSDNISDKQFRILLTVWPGSGIEDDVIGVMDNNAYESIRVVFKRSTGHIEARGSLWYDTGMTYNAGSSYTLEIIKDDRTHTFSLSVNGSWLLREITAHWNSPGIGYLYIYCGGNGGTYNPSQFTYLDDLAIQVPNSASQYSWPVGQWDRLDNAPDIKELASEKTNIAIGYIFNSSYEQIQAYLDQAFLDGLKVILETPRESGTGHITSDSTTITNFINKFKNHPAVYGWYIADEPASSSHSMIKAGYDIIKSLDAKPVFIAFMDRGDPDLIITYSDSYDIMLFDCYLALRNYAEFYFMSDDPYFTFQTRTKNAVSNAKQMGKPWWTVLQGQGRLTPPLDWDHRLPTLAEQRFMLYYGICIEDLDSNTYESAGGWLNWCHYLTKETLEYATDPYPYSGIEWLEDVYKPLAEEMNFLGTAMKNGTKTGVTDNQATTLTRLYQDPVTLDYYIISVNDYNGNKATTFTLNSSLGTFYQAQPMFENRLPLSISNAQFADNFSRFQVHVYKLIAN